MGENFTIAVIAPIQPEDFFDLLWQGVWEATFDLTTFGVQVQDLTTESRDVAGQRKLLENLLNLSVDAIALMPVHGCGLDDLIGQHIRNGTPVVTFHADAPESGRTAFVGPDLMQAGALAGEVLAKMIGERGRVLSFPGASDQFHLALRYEGFRNALQGYGDRIEETSCTCGCVAPENITPDLIASFGAIDGYFVGSEELAAFGHAIERSGLRRPCIGFTHSENVRPLLERGTLTAVIDENRYQLGYFAVQKAYEAVLKKNAPEPINSMQIPSTVVFAANSGADAGSLHTAFEVLVRQRTEILLSYKQRLEEANAKLVDLAVTDPLTGLYNRRKFEDVINAEVARARRWGPLSLLMIDLNSFKQVNDRYGHKTGDDVLKAVSRALLESCRSTDTCARLGGDEFAVILPHADFAAAQVVRNRIQQHIADTVVPCDGQELHFNVSIGIANLPDHADSAAALMAAADAAMYQCKQMSRQVLDSAEVNPRR
jgi:diguanylate cyclase (GGDEF)-like protein